MSSFPEEFGFVIDNINFNSNTIIWIKGDSTIYYRKSEWLYEDNQEVFKSGDNDDFRNKVINRIRKIRIDKINNALDV